MELRYVVIFTIIINSAMIDKHIKNLGKKYMRWAGSGHFVLVWYKTIYSALRMEETVKYMNKAFVASTLIGSG